MSDGTRDTIARALAILALLVAIVALADPCTPPDQPKSEHPSAG